MKNNSQRLSLNLPPSSSNLIQSSLRRHSCVVHKNNTTGSPSWCHGYNQRHNDEDWNSNTVTTVKAEKYNNEHCGGSQQLSLVVHPNPYSTKIRSASACRQLRRRRGNVTRPHTYNITRNTNSLCLANEHLTSSSQRSSFSFESNSSSSLSFLNNGDTSTGFHGVTNSSSSSLLSLYIGPHSNMVPDEQTSKSRAFSYMSSETSHTARNGRTQIGSLPTPSPSFSSEAQSFSPVLENHNSSANSLFSHPFSDSYSSPTSSMIFERSVQDVHLDEGGNKIPSHLNNEAFIPPVLLASTEALTDRMIDPERVEILSFRRPSSVRSFSFSDYPLIAPGPLTPVSPSSNHITSIDSNLAEHKHINSRKGSFSSISSLSIPCSPTLSPNPPFGNNTKRSPSQLSLGPSSTIGTGTQRSGISNLGSYRKDTRVLSFCSFADLISSESSMILPTVSTTLTSPLTPPNGIEKPPNLTVSCSSNHGTAIADFPDKNSVNSLPKNQVSPLSPLSPSMTPSERKHRLISSFSRLSLAAQDEEEPNELDVSSLGETLRRNTDIMTIH